MENCNLAETPMLPFSNHVISSKDNPKTYDYKAVIGALLYLSNATRPDIAFAVGYLARFQAAPKPIHFKLVTRIFRYLKKTKNFGLKYEIDKNYESPIDVYADADFPNEGKRKSTSGYLLRLQGVPFAWRSHLQTDIAGSTTEAELTAVNEAIKDVLYIIRLNEELLKQLPLPITIHEDNKSTIHNCTPHVSKNRLKHVARKEFQAAENVEKGYITLHKVSSAEQLADILTKPLADTRYKTLRDQIMTEIVNRDN